MSLVNLISPSSKWDGSFTPPAGNQTLDTIKTWVNGLSSGLDFVNTLLVYMVDASISGWSSCTVIRTLDNITTVTITNESTIIQMRRTAAGVWYVEKLVPKQGLHIKKGQTYNIGGDILVHTTGSGNYIDFTVPCTYDDTISSVSISFPSDSAWIVVLANGSQIYKSTINTSASTSIWKTAWGITFEFKLTETKASNTIGWMQGAIGFNATFS